MFCCGVTFLGDSILLVLSRFLRLVFFMWVCRILVVLFWNGLGRFVNIMDSFGVFRLNRLISINWAVWKLKYEKNELLLLIINFYLKLWSLYYILDDNRIKFIYIFGIFCIFCLSLCYWWWWWCRSKIYFFDFYIFGFRREVDDAW